MGYSVKPEYWDWSANNLGFLSDRDYPYTPENDRDEFIVGITGGSVANGLALESSKDIAQIINSLPGFARKKVVILNLCGGGHHQPQQLLTVSYLISRGQRFDLIINLDGFNEAYIGWENAQDHKVHATEPAAKFVFGLQNQLLSVHSDAAKKVFAIRAAKEAAQRKMAATRSALAYYAAWVGSRRLVEGEVLVESEIGNRKPDVDYPIFLQPATYANLEHMAQDTAQVWFRASVSLRALADSVGAVYIHMIQPNQYYRNRVFSVAEKKQAFSEPPHPGAVIVPMVYRRMLDASTGFAARGVKFVDATSAFNSHSEPLYIDPCCHFNKRGYDILIEGHFREAIAAAIKSHRGERESARQ